MCKTSGPAGRWQLACGLRVAVALTACSVTVSCKLCRKTTDKQLLRVLMRLYARMVGARGLMDHRHVAGA